MIEDIGIIFPPKNQGEGSCKYFYDFRFGVLVALFYFFCVVFGMFVIFVICVLPCLGIEFMIINTHLYFGHFLLFFVYIILYLSLKKILLICLDVKEKLLFILFLMRGKIK
jgi:hypothetical protein